MYEPLDFRQLIRADVMWVPPQTANFVHLLTARKAMIPTGGLATQPQRFLILNLRNRLGAEFGWTMSRNRVALDREVRPEMSRMISSEITVTITRTTFEPLRTSHKLDMIYVALK